MRPDRGLRRYDARHYLGDGTEHRRGGGLGQRTDEGEGVLRPAPEPGRHDVQTPAWIGCLPPRSTPPRRRKTTPRA